MKLLDKFNDYYTTCKAGMKDTNYLLFPPLSYIYKLIVYILTTAGGVVDQKTGIYKGFPNPKQNELTMYLSTSKIWEDFVLTDLFQDACLRIGRYL